LLGDTGVRLKPQLIHCCVPSGLSVRQLGQRIDIFLLSLRIIIIVG
jgi:hypothetical protein